MFKKIFPPVAFSFALLLTCGGTAFAAKSLDPISMTYSAGRVSQDGGKGDLYFAALHPGFALGRLSAIFDVSIFVDSQVRVRDRGNDSVVLNTLNYKDGDKFHLHYGEIENLTLGSGFIVSNYRTDVKGDVPLNRQKSVDMDVNANRSSIKVFATKNDLVGIRAVRNMGLITVGTTAVSDSNPDFEEYGIDFQAPLVPNRLSAYTELAKIADYGDGFSLGILSNLASYADAKLEFRDYDSDFAPGIVDEHFDAVPVVDRIKGNTLGRMSGYYSALDLFPGHKNRAAVTYEDYEKFKPRVTLDTAAVFTKKINGDLFFANQNFVPSSGGISGENVVRGRLSFMLNRRFGLDLDYYQAYNDADAKLRSLTAKVRYKLW